MIGVVNGDPSPTWCSGSVFGPVRNKDVLGERFDQRDAVGHRVARLEEVPV